jgi:TP901 family phage tail tape measure protein
MDRLGIGAILEFSAGTAVAEMLAAGRHVEALKSGFRSLGAGTAQVFGGLMQGLMMVAPALLAVKAAAAGAVVKFALFEENLAKIGTLLPGGTRQATEYADAIKNLAITYGQGLAVIGEGVFQAISASVKAEESTAFMRVAAQTAAAGFTDIKTSVDALTNVINAYGAALGTNATAAEKATRIADAMFTANREGKTTVDELSRYLGQVVSTSAQAKIPFEELTSAIAALTKTGLNTAMSVTSINQAILAFVSPSKQAKEAAARFGVDLSAATLASRGLQGALALVKSKIGGNIEAMAQFFPEVRALRGALVLAGEGAADFANILRMTREESGITAQKFADVSQGITFQFQRVLRAGEVAAVDVGEAIFRGLAIKPQEAGDRLVALFGRLGEKVEGFVALVKRGFTELGLPEKLKAAREGFERLGAAIDEAFGSEAAGRAAAIAAALGTLAAVAAPAALALLPLGMGLSSLVTVGSGLSTMVSGLVGVLGGAAGLLSGPVLIGIAAVAGAIAAFTLNAGGLRDAVMGLVGAVLGAAKPAWEALLGVWTALRPHLEVLVAVLGSALAPAVQLLTPIVSFLADTVARWARMLGALLTFLQPVSTIVGTVLVVAFKGLGAVLDATIIPAFEALRFCLGWVFDKLMGIIGAINEVLRLGGLLGQSKGLLALSQVTIGGARPGMPAPSPALAPAAATAVAEAKGAEVKAAAAAAGMAAVAPPPAQVTVENRVSLDGREVAAATSRAQLEITERAGARLTPWQRRQIVAGGLTLAAAR